MDDVADVFRTVLRLAPDFELRDSMSFADVPGWDSLGHLNIVNELERRHSVVLDLGEVAGVSTVKGFRDMMAGKKKA